MVFVLESAHNGASVIGKRFVKYLLAVHFVRLAQHTSIENDPI